MEIMLTQCNFDRIWLVDALQKLPGAQLDGLDISFDAAPPAETLPDQITFRHWNVKDSVPEDLIGTYDIIHVRFFSFVLLNDEIPSVVAKLFSLLSMLLASYLQSQLYLMTLYMSDYLILY